MDVAGSSVASSMGGMSSAEGPHSSCDEDAKGTLERVDKAVAIKRRKSSGRKPRTKGITRKLQDQVRLGHRIVVLNMSTLYQSP